MKRELLKTLLARVKSGDISIEQACRELEHLPFRDLQFAKVDHHRALRKDFPEVIFSQGKTPEQVRDIAAELLKNGETLLATRAGDAVFKAVAAVAPDAVFNRDARVVFVDRRSKKEKIGLIGIVTAGTADQEVAEEAAITAELMGSKVNKLYDVGVAGLHRLIMFQEEIGKANALVVIAGMDGVLPSVVGGLVSCPVIAVPTDVGYGANLNGLAPLLTMLNTCACGVAVVNINNGFGAGFMAGLINKMAVRGGRDSEPGGETEKT